MWRLLRAIMKKMFGWTGAFAESLEEDPDVIASTYDDSIKKSKDRVATTKQAIAKLMSIQDEKQRLFNNVTVKVTTLTKRRDGALARAKQIASDMQSRGVDAEVIKKDPEILKARQAYADLNVELEKATQESREKEADLNKLGENLNRLKSNLQSMQRGAMSLEEEKQGAIADVVTAKQQQAVDDLVAGISQEAVDKDLERARAARKNVVNRAKLSAEMAGLEQGASGAEYEKYADSVAGASEFDSLLGLESKVHENLDPAKLPES